MSDKAYLTAEAAEVLKCKVEKIYNTFKNYSENFVYGIDYVDLTGCALKEAKQRGEIPSKARNSVRIWSQSGVDKFKSIFSAMQSKRSRGEELSEGTLTGNNMSGVINSLIDEIVTMNSRQSQALINEMSERIKLLEKVIEDKDAQNDQYLNIIQQLLNKQ